MDHQDSNQTNGDPTPKSSPTELPKTSVPEPKHGDDKIPGKAYHVNENPPDSGPHTPNHSITPQNGE
ncbi:MAG: hypothetical protein ACK4XK_08915 [Casimicrobiaceae bacterium]